MANNKQRYVNTRFWNDNYVSNLDPTEKLLFIYLLTNEHTNISGVYELPFKIMAVETGIDESMFKKILPRLKGRIRYIKGIVVIKNHIKHQETKSPNVKTGILNCLKDLDKDFLENLINKGYYILPRYYIDTLCIPYIEGRNYLDSNLDSNLDLDSSITNKIPSKKEENTLIPELIKSFEEINPACKKMYGNTTQRQACEDLIESYGFEKVKTTIEVVLPKVKGVPFFPTITTPCQLRDKWASLETAIIRYQSENKSKVAFT